MRFTWVISALAACGGSDPGEPATQDPTDASAKMSLVTSQEADGTGFGLVYFVEPDPQDPTTEVADDACTYIPTEPNADPLPEKRDPGTLTVLLEGTELVLTETGPGSLQFSFDLDAPPTGSRLSVSTEGGDLGSWSAVDVVEIPAQLNWDGALPSFTWSADDAGATVRVEVGEDGGRLLCRAVDDGGYTVPQTEISEMEPTRFSLRRHFWVGRVIDGIQVSALSSIDGT